MGKSPSTHYSHCLSFICIELTERRFWQRLCHLEQLTIQSLDWIVITEIMSNTSQSTSDKKVSRFSGKYSIAAIAEAVPTTPEVVNLPSTLNRFFSKVGNHQPRGKWSVVHHMHVSCSVSIFGCVLWASLEETCNLQTWRIIVLWSLFIVVLILSVSLIAWNDS